MFRRICVFCGSSSGADPAYAEAAQAMGRLLAALEVEIVYGGGKVGLMGELADACLKAGGKVHGVIPKALVEKEIAHCALTALHVVASMHERKARMAELADAFIALPGGFGTWEELFEILTWAQLGLHRKPCGLLNVAGYYDALQTLMERAVHDEFLRDSQRQMLLVDDDPARLIQRLKVYEVPVVAKWIRREDQIPV